MKEIKKIVAIVTAMMLMVALLIVPVSAAQTTVTKTGVTKIEFEAFSQSYDDGTSNKVMTITKSANCSGGAYTAIHANVDWTAYDLYVEEGGLYKLTVWGIHPYGTTTTALECYEGTRLLSKGGMSASSDGSWGGAPTACEYENMVLKAGKTTIKFASKFSGFYDYFTLEKIGEAGVSIATSGETKIEFESFVHGYDSAASTGKLAASSQSQYSGSKYVALHSGTNPDYAEFDINVKETGMYNLKVAALHPSGITGTAAKVTEGSIGLTLGSISKPVEETPSWNSAPTVNDWGAILLTKGLTTIRFTGVTAAHYDYFTLTKVNDTEISTTITVPASGKTDSWDKSANKTHSISSSGYLSLGTGDWVTFELKVPVDGVYNIEIEDALPSEWGGTSPILVKLNVDGTETIDTQASRSPVNEWVKIWSTLATCELSAGIHTFTITGVQNEFWVYNFRVSKAGDIVKPIEESLKLEAENYVDYVDNTPGIDDEENNVFFGDDVEIVETKDGYAVQIEAGETLYYSLAAEESGYYNVKFLMEDIASAQNVEIKVGDKTLETEIVGAGEDGYALVTVGEVYLESGENDIEISNISEEGIFDLDCIKFYEANIAFTSEDEAISGVVVGGMDANIDFNGFLAGKDALCVFAVYDGGRLVAIDAEIIENVTNDTDKALSVELETVTNTNTAKAFVWDLDKQIGVCEILGE